MKNERSELVQAETGSLLEANDVLWSRFEITKRELHKEIIRLRDIPGINADCELTEVLRELAEIMVHGEKQSDAYFE